MLIGVDCLENNSVTIPIENYAQNLINDLKIYLDKIKIQISADIKSEVEYKLKSVVFRNENVVTPMDANSNNIWNIVQQYSVFIMTTIGQLAECLILRNCANDRMVNQICMNVAKFAKNPFAEYDRR